jgi:type II secretory pathway predicted ATPase ExeA
MFLEFYELKEQPFGVTPDPRYLYLGASHREALASLVYGAKTGRGLLTLIAPPGMGKTTLLFRFLEHLRGSARTVFLFQTQCDSFGLLRYLMADLGIDTRGQDFVTIHEKLNELLLREANVGRRFVLVIDEAQNLDDSVLETARLLSDFETPRQKLLQIVLAGQPQLTEKLARPELAQLRQRIAIRGHLEPFSNAEVSYYIDHRLRVAGYNAGQLFTSAAVDRIAATSMGIPRNINNLCFSALSLGCALRRKQIDTDVIDEAAVDLDLNYMADQRARAELPPVPPVTAEPEAPSLNTIVCRGGSDSTIAPTGPREAAMDTHQTWHGHPANGGLPSHRDEIKMDENMGVVFLESFEHAQERHAEVLAEIVEGGTSDDVYYVERADIADGGYRVLMMKTGLKDAASNRNDTSCATVHRPTRARGAVIETAGSETRLVEQVPCDSEKLTRGDLLGGSVVGDALARAPILSLADRKHDNGRLPVVVSVFAVALLSGVLYRQDLRIATAQPRSTLTLVTGDLSSRVRALIVRLAASPSTFGQEPTETGHVKTDRSVVVRQDAVAITTSVVPTQVSGPITPTRERHADLATTTSPQIELISGTTAVIVQPNDNLRQICLRYLGRYNAESVREIRELNPALSDPRHVAVGQRIVLPGSVSVRPRVSNSSSVSSP